MNIKKVQSVLFKTFIFFLPFQLGAIYTHLIEADLVFAFDLILGVLYALWIYEHHHGNRRKIHRGKLFIPALLLIVWTCFSLINAISLTMTGMGIYLLTKAFLVYFYCINHIRTKLELEYVIFWLMAALLFQGCLGFVQFSTGSSLGMEFLGAVVKERGLSGLTRIRGTLGYPNRFGAWLAILIPLASCMFVFETNARKKAYYGTATLMGTLALLLSFSRSAWIGIVFGFMLLVGILLYKRLLRVKYLVTLGVAAIAAAALVFVFWDLIMRRFETGADGTYRLRMIDIAFRLFEDHFLFGVGLNNYQFHSVKYFRFWHPVHNAYLRLLVETGIPGLLFFLVVIFTALKEGFAMLKCRDRMVFSVALGSVCGMIAFLMLVNFGPEYQHYRIKVLFWFIMGITFSLRRIYSNILRSNASSKQAGETTPASSQQPVQTPHHPAFQGYSGSK